ncbi:MAG: DUF4340 domain-containing protein [Candidatus Krumholzibacteriota bacterium]|nr:DUF4340 domain-containing protein [Candidatus Krumholzibacteriota bacterium]
MKIRTTVIFFLVLAVIAGYFYFDQKKTKSADEEYSASKALLPYTFDEIDSVDFFNPFGDLIKWKRDGDGWQVTYPVVTVGSKSMIDYMLKLTVPGRRWKSFDAEDRFADYGLENPSTSIILHNSLRSRCDTILFGDKTPLNTQCYVRLGSSKEIIVTTDLSRNLMEKTLYHLRDKNLLYMEADSISAFSFRKNTRSYFFEKDAEGNWVVAGTSVLADKNLIKPYLYDLVDALIYGFAAENMLHANKFGIDPKSDNILLSTRSGTVEVSFGKIDENFVYATRTGLGKIVKIESRYLDIFDWIDERIMVLKAASFDPAEVSGLVCEYPSETVRIDFATKSLSIDGNPSIEISTVDIQRILYMLISVSFDSGISPAADDDSEVRAARYSILGEDEILLDRLDFYIDQNGMENVMGFKTRSSGSTGTKNSREIRTFILSRANSSR